MCVSLWERERLRWGWVYVCVHVDVWEVVIWCLGVGVKADRMRIVIILVLHIWPINHIWMCELLFILQCISVTNIILSNNVYDTNIVCCCALLNFESFTHGHFLFFFFFFSFFKYVFVFVVVFVVWFGFLVPLNEIKKYLAWPDKINRNGGLLTNLMVNTPWNHNSQKTIACSK